MLREFIESQRVDDRKVGGEQPDQIPSRFLTQLLFLADPDSIPNSQINNLVSYALILANQGMLNYDIEPEMPDEQSGLLSLAKIQSPDHETLGDIIVVLFPITYLSQTRLHPIFALGQAAGLASVIMDTFNMTVDEEIPLERSFANQAEAYHTLKSIAKREGLKTNFGSYAEAVMRLYPNGIASLPRELRYSPQRLLLPKTDTISLITYENPSTSAEDNFFLN